MALQSEGRRAMAIMRCKRHTPTGRTKNYVGSVPPKGYPETALVCGSASCNEPAFKWLEADEQREFKRGERVFKAFTTTMKVRAA